MISVIITTKNEEKNIGSALKSIGESVFNQDEIEVIVVDNNSSDKTKEIAEKYGAKVFNKGPERSAQRNLGAREALGKYIFYMDADMILSPGVLSEVVEKFERDEELVGIYIREKVLGKGFWAKVRDYERQFYNKTVVDAVRFMRRDDFLRIGGFDESLTGPEDWDLDKRIRKLGKVDILKSVVYHNEKEVGLLKMLSKKKYYSNGFEGYKKKWGDDKEVKKQFGLWYRYALVFFENGKWKRVVKHPVLFCAVIFSKFFVGIIYLLRKRK